MGSCCAAAKKSCISDSTQMLGLPPAGVARSNRSLSAQDRRKKETAMTCKMQWPTPRTGQPSAATSQGVRRHDPGGQESSSRLAGGPTGQQTLTAAVGKATVAWNSVYRQQKGFFLHPEGFFYTKFGEKALSARGSSRQQEARSSGRRSLRKCSVSAGKGFSTSEGFLHQLCFFYTVMGFIFSRKFFFTVHPLDRFGYMILNIFRNCSALGI